MSDEATNRAEPLVGWRLWKARNGKLHSWAVDHVWQPGANNAICLSDPPYRCDRSPGISCKCGYWGLYSPRAAVEIARATMSTEAVMGLVVGYGTVALHGPEGFRAESAMVTCLFTDELVTAPLERLWHGLERRLHRMWAVDANDEMKRRTRDLSPFAAEYAVPLVTLRGALSLGLLGELGVQHGAIRELEAWLGGHRPPSQRGRPEYA